MSKAKVYFTKEITAEAMIKMYKALGCELDGKVAVKIHSGEVGNQNFIRPDFLAPITKLVDGEIVECNTAYEGKRYTTSDHMETMKLHGWCDIANVNILDSDGDLEIEIKGGKQITKNFLGAKIKDYDSLLVLSHFKGHPMGGFGGALKNISIGLASSYGKAYIHGAGEPEKIWTADHNSFLDSMADAAKSVNDMFRGRVAYINIMKNISVDCDCCAVAEDPAIADIGILSSLNPVALDKACLDLVYASNDEGRDHLLERIESRNGKRIIDTAVEIGLDSDEYELIEI